MIANGRYGFAPLKLLKQQFSWQSTQMILITQVSNLSPFKVLGYRVVASSSTAVKQDYNEYMWTMRKDFAEPEPVEDSTFTVPKNKIDVPE
jgi:hypothetical protein